MVYSGVLDRRIHRIVKSQIQKEQCAFPPSRVAHYQLYTFSRVLDSFGEGDRCSSIKKELLMCQLEQLAALVGWDLLQASHYTLRYICISKGHFLSRGKRTGALASPSVLFVHFRSLRWFIGVHPTSLHEFDMPCGEYFRSTGYQISWYGSYVPVRSMSKLGSVLFLVALALGLCFLQMMRFC